MFVLIFTGPTSFHNYQFHPLDSFFVGIFRQKSHLIHEVCQVSLEVQFVWSSIFPFDRPILVRQRQVPVALVPLFWQHDRKYPSHESIYTDPHMLLIHFSLCPD